MLLPDSSGTVLITGGAGFLGTRIIRRFLSMGKRIIVLDDGSSGTNARIAEFELNPMITIYRTSILNADAVAEVVAIEQPSIVVHLAAWHFIPVCEENPNATWQVNVDGTCRLINALDRYPPKRLIFASTGEVYKESSSPHLEDDTLESYSVYGRSKIAAEELLLSKIATWRTGFVIARLFNLYGPDPTTKHLIPTILEQASKGNHLCLGNLNSFRDYVWVDDAASALISLMFSTVSGVFNIGTGIATSGRQLVSLVAELLARDFVITLEHNRMRKQDRPMLIANPTKLKFLIPDWPLTPLSKGIQQLLLGHPTDPS